MLSGASMKKPRARVCKTHFCGWRMHARIRTPYLSAPVLLYVRRIAQTELSIDGGRLVSGERTWRHGDGIMPLRFSYV